MKLKSNSIRFSGTDTYNNCHQKTSQCVEFGKYDGLHSIMEVSMNYLCFRWAIVNVDRIWVAKCLWYSTTDSHHQNLFCHWSPGKFHIHMKNANHSLDIPIKWTTVILAQMKAAILKVPQPYDLHGIHEWNLVMQGHPTISSQPQWWDMFQRDTPSIQFQFLH